MYWYVIGAFVTGFGFGGLIATIILGLARAAGKPTPDSFEVGGDTGHAEYEDWMDLRYGGTDD